MLDQSKCGHKDLDGYQLAYGLCDRCGLLVGYTLEQKIDYLIQLLITQLTIT